MILIPSDVRIRLDYGSYSNGRLSIIKAPIIPGTHAQSVSKKTIIKDPQPLSKTASGGKKIAKISRKMLIFTQRYKFVIS
jgi:hypothetical protein